MSTVPVSVKIAVSPTASVPMVNRPVFASYEPCVTELDAKVIPDGSVSVSETPVA